MKACRNCRFGDRALDGESVFYFCRLNPPTPNVVNVEKGQDIAWLVPTMKPAGWCGQFRLAFFRWLASFGRRGT